MSSPATLEPAIAGSHTVFLVTNYWDAKSRSAETEVAQGRAVAEKCKAAGVAHLVFSSLISPAELCKGRTDKVPHIPHFESKAAVEEYIRSLGVPATFVNLGWYMENFFMVVTKNEEGGLVWTLPINGDTSQFPLIDAGKDTGAFFSRPPSALHPTHFRQKTRMKANLPEGNFVRAALKQSPPSGKRILVATEYATPNRIMADLAEITGKRAVFESSPPEVALEEMRGNYELLENPGYFGGMDLTEGVALLDEKPGTWREFVKKNKDKWA